MSEFPVVTRYEVKGAEDVLATNAQLWRSFQEGGVSAQAFSKSLKESMEPIQAEQRLLNATRMTLRVGYAEWNQFGRVLSGVGSIGRNLVSMWQAYTIGQIHVEQTTENVEKAQLGVAKAHKKVEDAQKEVSKWQKLYNQYLRDFGADSTYTKNAQDELTTSQEYLVDAQQGEVDANVDLKAAIEANTKALENLTLGYISLGLQSVSTAADIIRIVTALGGFFALIEAKGGFLATLEAGLTNAGIAASGLALALAPIMPALIPLILPENQEQIKKTIEGIPEFAGRIQKEAETHPWWHWIPFAGLFEPKTTPQPATYTQPAATWAQPSAPLPSSYWNMTPSTLYTSPSTTRTGVGTTGYSQETIDQVIADMFSGAGGYQFGTPYIPETGAYILHKGERVQTAEEARETRTATANKFNVVFHIYAQTVTDPEMIADYALKKMKKWVATGAT